MSIPRLDLEQAIREVQTSVSAVPETESVATENALNRVLGQPVAAPLSLPPFNSSAMDGYAYKHDTADLGKPLRLVGVALAGHPFRGVIGPQECVRITTGAEVPKDADTVVIQEDTTLASDKLTLTQVPERAENVRAIGHDVHQGARLLDRGLRLNPFTLSWLAACGIEQVQVRRRPRVVVFSSGDELVPPGALLQAGQIYDSNRLLLLSLLQSLPVTLIDGGRLPDDPEVIRDTLTDLQQPDLVITSGGVSVGDADFLTQVVESLGSLQFWRLNLKPGKPLAFGRIGEAWYLGLPGNPVSTAVTALLLGKPTILALAGAKQEPEHCAAATLTQTVQRKPGRTEFQRGYLSTTHGALTVAPTGDQSSNRLATFREANCLIRFEKDSGDAAAGSLVSVLPFSGLL